MGTRYVNALAGIGELDIVRTSLRNNSPPDIAFNCSNVISSVASIPVIFCTTSFNINKSKLKGHGNFRKIQLLDEGQNFTSYELLTDSPRTVTSRSIRYCISCKWNRKSLQNFVAKSISMYRHV